MLALPGSQLRPQRDRDEIWSWSPEDGLWYNAAKGWDKTVRLTPPALDFSGDGSPDFLVKDATGNLSIIEGNGFGGWRTEFARALPQTVPGYNALVTPGDWDGDGYADLMARKAADGTLWLFKGDGKAGFLGSPTQIGSGWNDYNPIMAPGDYSGDGKPDIVARRTNGDLYLFKGNGTGGWDGNGAVIGVGWQNFNLVAAPGDFSGDGKPDIFARSGNTLSMYKSDGAGGWLDGALPTQIAQYGIGTDWAWGNFTHLHTPGDFTGDGLVDVVAQKSDGKVWLLKGDGAGGWVHSGKNMIAVGWEIFDYFIGAGDFGGDGKPDLLARGFGGDNHGKIFRMNSSNGAFSDGVVFGNGWEVFNTILGPGDWDGDNKRDVLARKPDGTFWYYKGDGAGGWLGGGAGTLFDPAGRASPV